MVFHWFFMYSFQSILLFANTDVSSHILVVDTFVLAKSNMGRRVMRVSSANVLDEGLRIGGRGRRMNSKVKISQTRRCFVGIENKRGTQLVQSQSVSGRPLLTPIYRWSGLEEPVGFNTNYIICIRHHLIFRLYLCLGLSNGP
jgi:hypothetical protein